MSKDPKTQRQLESQLIKFIAAKKEEGNAPATLQLYFAAVRSFFEINYCPLRMRRGDYPKGDSLGVRVATKEAIGKVIDHKQNRNKPMMNAAVLFLKDSGLRVSDARLFNAGDIREQLESGADFIPITRITQKAKITAKTFIGIEAIQALKIYLKARENGTRRIPPEQLTDKSPLFRTMQNGAVKRIPRGSFSSLIRQAFLRIGEQDITAHSLRKFLQTNLEAAGVNVNWIDQILGHKLINSRDAYSKPTDDQLKEAYIKAYKFLRVLPDLKVPECEITQRASVEDSEPTRNEQFTVKTATSLDEVTRLLADGYQYAATFEGIQLFKKRK